MSCSFHFIKLPLFLDQFADLLAALAGALGAFDAENVELAVDVAEDEIGARHDGALIASGNESSTAVSWSAPLCITALPVNTRHRVPSRVRTMFLAEWEMEK